MCLAEIRDVKSKAVVAFWHRGSRKILTPAGNYSVLKSAHLLISQHCPQQCLFKQCKLFLSTY